MIRYWIGRLFITLSKSPFWRALRTMPVLGGTIHNVSHLLLPWNQRVWVTIEQGLGKGLKFKLNPRYEAVFWDGHFEQKMQDILARYLKKGDCVYDVGAHIGFVSLLAARLVGPSGRVFAFEPALENLSRLEENLMANEMIQVEVVPAAAWSKPESLSFDLADEHSTQSMGYVKEGENSAGTLTVAAKRLDDFAVENPPPKFIKMDIEGAEVEALKGAERIFTEVRPILLCEVHHQEADDFLRKWLGQKGYQQSWLGEDGGFPDHVLAVPDKKHIE